MAQSGLATRTDECPLLGVKRTLFFAAQTSAYDPKRTSLPRAATPFLVLAQAATMLFLDPRGRQCNGATSSKVLLVQQLFGCPPHARRKQQLRSLVYSSTIVALVIAGNHRSKMATRTIDPRRIRVIRGRCKPSMPCPLYPRTRTFVDASSMSAMGQKQTSHNGFEIK